MSKLHILRPQIPTGPVTRGECRDTWTLTCNLVGCRYNLRHQDRARGEGGNPPTPVPLSTVVRYRSCALNIAEEIPSSDMAPVKPRKTVATARVAHGMRTQWEVAQLLGVTHQAVQNIEERALRKLLRHSAAERAYQESEGQADRAGASLPGGMEEES